MTSTEPERNDDARLAPLIRFTHPAARAFVIGSDGRVQRWAGRRLRQAGFDVLVFAHGLEAVAAAHLDAPDLVVIDHLVADVDVRYVLVQLRRARGMARVPIMLVAPYTNTVLAQVCREFDITFLVTGERAPRARLRAHWPRPSACDLPNFARPAESTLGRRP